MKNLLLLMSAAFLLVFVVGCSDDDNPVAPDDNPQDTETSTCNESGGYWQSLVNGASYDEYGYFSFATRDTVSGGTPKLLANDWDIAFRREAIMLNGGSSADNGGDVEGADLGVVDFDAVTIDDTAGVSWTSDAVDYFIDEWWEYNPDTHVLTFSQYVYSMVDAGGHNYLKFRVDSLVGAGSSPQMGTVYITYFYQTEADSRSLAGDLSHASITVGMETGYFDFSTGSQVTPTDPASSLEWDIGFSAYNLFQNSGPSGSGECEAFLAHTELVDPTDIENFLQQPSMAPMFPDIPASALTEWYAYNGETHQLTSLGNVYLIKSAGTVYKVRIESYYTGIGGVPTSGHYTFIWVEL